MNYQILQGDCITSMRGLPSGIVQTCVTSPPYFGLRDYGTGEWEGGDPGCNHKPSSTPGKRGLATSTLGGSTSTTASQQSGYGQVCPRCGAHRIDQQIGLEETPEEYVAKLVEVFREVRRLLKDDGTLWLNLGDSYNGSGGAGGDYGVGGIKEGQPRYPGRRVDGLKPKDLIGIPWMVAFTLRADGWYLRSDIIWAKPNPMPESVTDRPTKAHEYIFLLSKSERYYYDAEASAEKAVSTSVKKFTDGGNDKQRGHSRRHAGFNGRYAEKLEIEGVPTTRNRRSVWTVATSRYGDAHFATYPPDLIEPCILAGSRAGDTVLDPFNGSGTTGAVALKFGRQYIGCELNPDYIELAHERIRQSQPMLLEVP